MFDMAEPVLMMSETANPDLIDVSPDCREQICCDSLLPALVQERVWLAGYSRLRTRYRIDSFQKTYFVIDSYEQLMDATRADFSPIYARLAHESSLPAGTVLDADQVFNRGTGEGWATDADA